MKNIPFVEIRGDERKYKSVLINTILDEIPTIGFNWKRVHINHNNYIQLKREIVSAALYRIAQYEFRKTDTTVCYCPVVLTILFSFRQTNANENGTACVSIM